MPERPRQRLAQILHIHVNPEVMHQRAEELVELGATLLAEHDALPLGSPAAFDAGSGTLPVEPVVR